MTAQGVFFCSSPLWDLFLLPCCGDRAWSLRPSAAESEFTLKFFKNTMQKCYFFGASYLCAGCGDRAWYLRHSAVKWKVFSFLLFGRFLLSERLLSDPPGSILRPFWSSKVAPWSHKGFQGGQKGAKVGPKAAQSESKAVQRELKAAQTEAKRAQGLPEASPKGATGAQSRPEGAQN